VGFVLCQLIAVEIPMCILVLSQMRLSARIVARRLAGIAVAALIMAVACVAGRSALEAAGVGMAGRAALTIVLGMAVYTVALWWLAPHVSRRVLGICRSRLARMKLPRRRPAVLQPERG
jgi:hypothetical protein